ncbi:MULTISPECIES: DegT/DnrJ/EryC1/StrS family aminotransferase [Paenibacillus]|uniref:DegT/DnrJ/EryC1/StrS family aminotransferase n=1 Tax=Paenibacillus alvei TaxID=44250 RepID=A0ABT4E3V3_PAEAL|nr:MULTISPECIES: DegT/DnrJ/EryC1/StrS family aminotransferase [Paenibacillus]EPY12520.1 DegT/DnrJ/EryC1/StrS aminotransferase [Paenibacillus alvei A6-6i-x]MCY9528431.1 DegT/DnrJ/EryC1/StrS family aminotransferase [Paenibacillus alvei]SDE35262.1 perosamine synthetase [Paenibacillus sp. cl6col]
MNKYYPIATPVLNGNETKYVLDCLNTTWISSNGPYLDQFEQQFAAFCQSKHAIACSNGTTALHLALLAHDVGPGDEVIVPTLTFVATANAVTYCGALPVFVDVEADTWNMDIRAIEQKITSRTKGIIAVHLYGHPADMDPIMELAHKYDLFVIEDAAEAIGAQYKGRMAGALGHTATFSLFGNKVITTGEGGVVTTNNEAIAEKIRLLRGQGIDKNKKYWHPVIGYNYRMTNIQAAIGCAQLEKVEWHIRERIRVAMHYYDYLKHDSRLTLPVQRIWAKNVFWMFSIVLNGYSEQQRDHVMQQLKDKGIETRPFFYPMHILPPYRDGQLYEEYPVANRIASQGMNLPSHGELTKQDIQYICQSLQDIL